MFSEILKIIPRLSSGDAKKMENDLNRRFRRVARRFGQGINFALKGTIFGIGTALLARLLAPLEAVEERIKKLLGQGDDISDMAQRFGGSAGSLMRVEAVGQALGLSPEDLNKMMTSYAEAVEAGRKEMAERARNPKAELSSATKILSSYLGDTDMVEGFFKFIQSLQSLSPENRRLVESEVLGGAQHGAARRFMEADMAAVIARLNLPAASELDAAAKKTSELQRLQDLRDAQLRIESFVRGSRNVQPSMIESMADAERRKELKEIKNILQFHEFANSAKGFEEIFSFIEEVRKPLLEAVSLLPDFIKGAKAFFGETKTALGKLLKRAGLGGW